MDGLQMLQRIQKDDCVTIILTAFTDEFTKKMSEVKGAPFLWQNHQIQPFFKTLEDN
jgi:hypothetical protein